MNDTRNDLARFRAEIKEKAKIKDVLDFAYNGATPGSNGKTHCLDKGCGGTDTAHIYETNKSGPGRLQCFKCSNEFKRLELRALNVPFPVDKTPPVDVFDILQKVAGLDFSKACETLSRMTGVPLPKKRELSDEEKEDLVRIGKIKDVLKRAADFYFFNLIDENAFKRGEVKGSSKNTAEAKMYLLNRDVKGDSIVDFRIGTTTKEGLRSVFPDYDTNPFLLAAGLVKTDTDGTSRYDQFRNRVVFPFLNKDGDVIGFSGRALEDNPKQKYINTPTTELFKKGTELFGLYQARPHIIKKNRALFVEGQMDVTKCHFYHIKETLASSGTAVTSGQIESVFKLCDEIIFCFDADYAGYTAAFKSVLTAAALVDSRKKVSVMFSPEGKDPDQFFSLTQEESRLSNDEKNLIRKNKLAVFEAAIAQRKPVHEVLIEITAQKLRGSEHFDASYDFNKETDVTFMAKVLDEMVDVLANFKNDIYRATLTRSMEVQMAVAKGFLSEKVESQFKRATPTINHRDIANDSTVVAKSPILTLSSFLLLDSDNLEKSRGLIEEIKGFNLQAKEMQFLVALHDLISADPYVNVEGLISHFKDTDHKDTMLYVGDLALALDSSEGPETPSFDRTLDVARAVVFESKALEIGEKGFDDEDSISSFLELDAKRREARRMVANSPSRF
ncbi:hypothetical protein CL689_03855 [Candidatus Saccharibacteria bacterium]|nr:hypothetical protein [Candidatus Saccharibacteria bacterium]